MEQFLIDWEGPVLLWIQEHMRNDFLTPVLTFLTHLGDHGYFWIALTILFLLLKKTRKVGGLMTCSLLLNTLVNNVLLKNLVARTRPYEVVDGLHRIIEAQSDYSFPSGHTGSAFAVAVVVFLMCPRKIGVPVLAVLLLRSLGVFGTPAAAETTPTPAPTVPVETVVPTETPTPTPTPKPEPTYEVVKADVSWADAEAAAKAKGGHLVVIDSAEKWTRVAQLADESGLTYVWIGLYRADSGELAWVKDNIDPVYNWAAGEPSVRDTNGAAENYVLIARRSDGWYYNDCIGDPAARYPQFYGGKTGYIIEIDP